MSWVSPTGSMEEKIFHFSRWISWSVTPLVCILGPRAPSPNGGGGQAEEPGDPHEAFLPGAPGSPTTTPPTGVSQRLTAHQLGVGGGG